MNIHERYCHHPYRAGGSDWDCRECDSRFQVKAGQHLLVLEAMKMENNIDADRDGIIVELKVNKGDSVLEGDTLLTIG